MRSNLELDLDVDLDLERDLVDGEGQRLPALVHSDNGDAAIWRDEGGSIEIGLLGNIWLEAELTVIQRVVIGQVGERAHRESVGEALAIAVDHAEGLCLNVCAWQGLRHNVRRSSVESDGRARSGLFCEALARRRVDKLRARDARRLDLRVRTLGRDATLPLLVG